MVKLLGVIIKYFAPYLLLYLTDDFEGFAVALAGLMAISILDEVNVGLNGSIKDFLFDEAILMLVLGLKRAVAAVASVYFIIFFKGLLVELVVFYPCYVFLPDLLVEIQLTSTFRSVEPVANLS